MPTEAECNAADNPKHTNFVDSQGSTFTFNNITYGATSVNLQVDGYDAGDQSVDLSTLSLPSGCCRPKTDPPLYDCGDTTSDGTLTLNWYCEGDNGTVTNVPTTEIEANLEFPKFGIDQLARCTSLSLDASVGEFVTGSATFELSKT